MDKTPSPRRTTPMPLPRALRLYWAATFAAFCLMFVAGYMRMRAGQPATHYNPLGGPAFDDLLEYRPTFRLLHTAAFYRNPVTHPVAYPPFGAAIYAGLYATGHPVAVYVGVAVAWLAAVTVAVGGWLSSRGVCALAAYSLPPTVVAMAFPVEGMIAHGNIELFLWIFAATGTWAWRQGSDKSAATLWACAAAIKLYPLIFLLLLLPTRKYRAVLTGLATFAGLSVASMLFLGPTFAVAWRGSLHNVFGYQGVRVSEWSLHELATNHSAFTWVKLWLAVFRHGFAGATVPYFAVGGAIVLALFALRTRSMPATNQLLTITTFMVLFPPVSYFHTLVHLFAPLALLAGVALEAERENLQVPGLTASMLLFVPLSASFMLLTAQRHFLFGGLVQGALLCVLFYRSLRFAVIPAPATLLLGHTAQPALFGHAGFPIQTVAAEEQPSGVHL